MRSHCVGYGVLACSWIACSGRGEGTDDTSDAWHRARTVDSGAPRDAGTDAPSNADTGVADSAAPPPLKCGNAATDPGEACDGASLNGYSCAGSFAGYTGGTLRCRPDCGGFDVSQCLPGNAIQATDCGYAAVSHAVSLAGPGDVVSVPAGTCTWDSTLAVSASIWLRGAGVGVTIIQSGAAISGGFLLSYSPPSYTANPPFRVSGFTFNLQKNSAGIVLDSTDAASVANPQTNIRVDHNRFTSASTQVFTNWGTIAGVFDNNVVDGTSYPFRSDNAYFYEGEWWDNWPLVIFGADRNNFYFEDNVVNGVSDMLSDCQFANRYAFRYNTINLDPAASYVQLFDMHGNAGTSGMWSCFGGEIYGNLVNGPSTGIELGDQRGGRAVFFYNKLIVQSAYSQVREEYDDALDPTSHQPQRVTGSYYWNNRHANSDLVTADILTDPSWFNGLAENVDFYNQSSQFDGSAGIGCGLTTNMPGTCTPGVAYWATNQSCTTVESSSAGAKPSVPIRGILYKCTANNVWSPFFTPLPYPHPLVTGP
jgi:hypothetical protein